MPSKSATTTTHVKVSKIRLWDYPVFTFGCPVNHQSCLERPPRQFEDTRLAACDQISDPLCEDVLLATSRLITEGAQGDVSLSPVFRQTLLVVFEHSSHMQFFEEREHYMRAYSDFLMRIASLT
jgi:hypothetical protein